MFSFLFVSRLGWEDNIFALVMLIAGLVIAAIFVGLRYRGPPQKIGWYEVILFFSILLCVMAPVLILLDSPSWLGAAVLSLSAWFVALIMENPGVHRKDIMPEWSQNLPAFYFYLLAILVTVSGVLTMFVQA